MCRQKILKDAFCSVPTRFELFDRVRFQRVWPDLGMANVRLFFSPYRNKIFWKELPAASKMKTN